MSIKRDLSDLPKPDKAKADAWAPDAEPRFAQLLVEQWHAENAAAGAKPRAHKDARFRHSDAGKCARAVAYAALDVPHSNPMDLTGVWNTRLGTMIHDAWQDALQRAHPDAEIETRLRSCDGRGAGHIDAIIHQPRHGAEPYVTAYELKTIGGFGFKMAVGERRAAEGPKFEHVAQAALNAEVVGADEVVIGYLSKEAISVAAAARKGIDELGRFLAEWTLTREEYMPYATAEAQRVAGILELIDAGTLPARKFPTPELPAGAVIVDPAKGRWEEHDADGQILDTGTFWACGYCNWQDVCSDTEAGRTPVETVVAVREAS